MRHVFATTTDGVPITVDSIAWETTDMDLDPYYQRYEDNDVDIIYIRKYVITGNILKIYEAYDLWANRATTLLYTAIKA